MAVITRPAAANWWKFLVVGAAVLGAVNVVASIRGEVDGIWLPMFVTTLVSLAILVTGLMLGIMRLTAGPGAKSPH